MTTDPRDPSRPAGQGLADEVARRLMLMQEDLDPADAREVAEKAAADPRVGPVATRWLAEARLPAAPTFGPWTPAMLMPFLRPSAALEALTILGRDPEAALLTRPGNPNRLSPVSVVGPPGLDRGPDLERVRRWLVETQGTAPAAAAATAQVLSIEGSVLDLALRWVESGAPPERPQVGGHSAAGLAASMRPSAVLQALVGLSRDPEIARRSLDHVPHRWGGGTA